MASDPQDDRWPRQRVVSIREKWWIKTRGTTYQAVPFRWYNPRHWWAWFEQWRFERKYW